jgi:hypothetical protein
MVDIEAISFTVRFFSEGKLYGDEYKAILTVQKSGYIAFISGLHGSINRKDYDELTDKLEALGVTELRWLKHGKEKKYST